MHAPLRKRKEMSGAITTTTLPGAGRSKGAGAGGRKGIHYESMLIPTKQQDLHDFGGDADSQLLGLCKIRLGDRLYRNMLASQ